MNSFAYINYPLFYHNGKEKAIGFLVGQTMKAMKGKADPASVNQMLKELL